jgi:hypothetical protein
MLKTAKTNPTVFFATCARLIPQDVKLTVEQQLPGNLSMEDWQVMKEIIGAIRQAIPDANSKPPGAVLEHVLDALRLADARVSLQVPCFSTSRTGCRTKTVVRMPLLCTLSNGESAKRHRLRRSLPSTTE